MERSQWVVLLPIGLGGRFGYLEVQVIEGDTPLLLSKLVMKRLGGIIDLVVDTITFRKIGVTVQTREAPSGHMLVDLLSFTQFGPTTEPITVEEDVTIYQQGEANENQDEFPDPFRRVIMRA